MEKLSDHTPKTAPKRPPGVKVPGLPRTLTKKAIRAYFDLDYGKFKKMVNERIIREMGIDLNHHRYIKEYDYDQTKVLIRELELTDEELQGIAKYM